MLTAKKVAQFFIYLMSNEEDELTNLKLNKLLYYAQGHALKRFHHPIFNDKLEAWQHGPVVADIYHEYKRFGKNAITELTDSFDINSYTEDEKELLVDVAREYGCFTGTALRNMTHKAGTPWTETYRTNSRHKEIELDLIRKYFEENERNIEFSLGNLSDDDFVGYHNDRGELVLKEYYEY